jgi:hypothetical protein
MRQRLQRRSLLCGAAFVAVLSILSVDIRGQAGKRPLTPLTYDVCDTWKTIQGTTLSRDGAWLSYATTAQGVDGELIVQNLQSGRSIATRAASTLRSRPTRTSSSSRSPIEGRRGTACRARSNTRRPRAASAHHRGTSR